MGRWAIRLTISYELDVTDVPRGAKHLSGTRDGVKRNTMPIPPFSIDGVLPPYIGPSGPGGRAEDMSPYVVTAFEVVSTFGGSNERAKILDGWLRHRAQLQSLGFQRGFQWLNGSFLEDKEPRDLDIVSFLFRPAMFTVGQLSAVLQANRALFDPGQLKQSYLLHAFFVDLNGSPETIVNASRYYFGLFSHRRGDELWKGMLQVSLDNPADDGAAREALGAATSAPVKGTLP